MNAEVNKNNICIIESPEFNFDKIVSLFELDDFFNFIKVKSFTNIIHLIKLQTVKCVILHIDENNIIMFESNIIRFKTLFFNTPLIGILKELNIELARKCGELGLSHLYSEGQMYLLKKELKNCIEVTTTKVTVKDFEIDIEACTDLAKTILYYIEKNYIRLMNIDELINTIGISEAKLNNELKKSNLPCPKRVIMNFKVKHAILLMQNRGLNLTEIAGLSGFSNNKRFGECFYRIFNMSPKIYRNKYIIKNLCVSQ